MKKLALGLLALTTLALAEPLAAQIVGGGGVGRGGIDRGNREDVPAPPPPIYMGPGDTVPPQLRPGFGGPGDARGANRPGAPGSAGVPGPATGPGAAGAAARTGAPTFTDVTDWSDWWEFNKEPYLRVKAAVYRGVPTTGEDEFALGRPQTTRSLNYLRPPERVIRGLIVPALLEALAAEPQNDTRNAIVLALARIGDDGDRGGEGSIRAAILPFLRDGSQGVSENACIALGVLAQRTGVTLLSALLGDTEEGRILCGRSEVPDRMRAFAAYGLGITADRSGNADVRRYAVHQLTEALGRDEALQDVKVACMLGLGVAAPGLDPGLEGGEGSSHGFSDELATELLRFFDGRDNDYLVRAHVPTTLARLAPYVSAELARTVKERLVAVVTRKVKDRNEVLQSAVVALGLVGDMDEDPVDTAIRAALMQNAAGGSDQLASFFARIALGKVAARAGEGAGDPTAGELEVRRFLYELLEQDKSQSRPWTAVAMGVMGFALGEQGKGLSTSELNALRYGLAQSDSPSIMGAFGIALGLASDGLGIEALSAKIEGTSEEVARGYMALGIGLTGNHEGTRALEGVLRSSLNKPAALERAAIAMILVGNRDIVPELLELYESTGSLASRISLVRALGRTGDERAARPLVDVMRDDESPALLRAWSAAALGWLADAAELPYTAALSVDVNYLASPPTLTSRGGDGIIDFR